MSENQTTASYAMALCGDCSNASIVKEDLMDDPTTHRSFSTKWSGQDNEFVGLCDQFPSLSWLAPTEAASMAGIMTLVADIDMEEGYE